ncbi:unnamed protein product [Danaus chrysippus]|uniref:(African queen) hypothetical protein n=1 Tax=Danaus chrysippus TaxID=151541 RepID=A0A8J2VZ74_9NEOP|nr:unnamed protein product [Danaus chrysippus]
MLDELLGEDEDACVENVAIGASTVAMSRYVNEEIEKVSNGSQIKPVILLDAGQDAGSETVGFALYIIEQLAACVENKDMIRNFLWIILPSTNPDGQEYSRGSFERWQKNYRSIMDYEATGVDITRNFDDFFTECFRVENKFSQNYPGPHPNSENETKFITNVMKKYKNGIKTYISFRRNGHAILYPFASRNVTLDNMQKTKTKADEIAKKVNQRAGGIQWFVSQSIYEMNGQPHCGHSVDYAYNKMDIHSSFEMRIFPETDNYIMSKFQSLPKGYDVSLRTGYFSGIREIYNLLESLFHFSVGCWSCAVLVAERACARGGARGRTARYHSVVSRGGGDASSANSSEHLLS